MDLISRTRDVSAAIAAFRPAGAGRDPRRRGALACPGGSNSP